MINKPLVLLFEENELNISSLYSLYAQLLPGQQVFWNQLSVEEVAHAAQIGNKKEEDNAIEENNLTRGMISHFISEVLIEIEKAQENGTTHEEALQVALRLEQSLLEKRCFDVLLTSKESVKEVLKRLDSETKRHTQMILEEMKKNGFRMNK